jgi:hypothetical protein
VAVTSTLLNLIPNYSRVVDSLITPLFTLLKSECKNFMPISDLFLLNNCMRLYRCIWRSAGVEARGTPIGYFIFALIHGSCGYFDMNTGALRKLE